MLALPVLLKPHLLMPALFFTALTPSAFGQLPKRLEKCLPYPTFAQEIQDKQPKPDQVRVHVVRVDFDADEGIPGDAQDEISDELRGHVFPREATGAYLEDLSNEVAEVAVRRALRNRGYFMVS